jgi:Glycosyl transferases group 1
LIKSAFINFIDFSIFVPFVTSIIMQYLASLPYPVYFVNPDSWRWSDLMTCPELPADLESVYERCVTGEEVWTAQTFVHLRQRGLNVGLVAKPVPGKICVIPSDYLHVKRCAFNSYVVGFQTDRARPEICEQRIVFNELGVKTANDHFTPHWHHPLLQPRDRSRGDRVENLVFKGVSRNLAQSFHHPDFSQQLKHLGVAFSCSRNDPKHQMRDWGDYRQTDIVLGVRNATLGDLSLKPAVKLINAWTAGSPAILSPEPAYSALRRSELDYIEVRTAQEVIEAIQRLKEQPKLYAAMVQNGLERAQEFTVDQIALHWRELLAGSIAQGYEQWMQQSLFYKLAGRPIQHAQRALEHKRQIKIYVYNREHGERSFTENQPISAVNSPTPASGDSSDSVSYCGSPMTAR